MDDGPESAGEAGPDYRLMGVRASVILAKVVIPAVIAILGFHRLFADIALLITVAVVIPLAILGYSRLKGR